MACSLYLPNETVGTYLVPGVLLQGYIFSFTDSNGSNLLLHLGSIIFPILYVYNNSFSEK